MSFLGSVIARLSGRRSGSAGSSGSPPADSGMGDAVAGIAHGDSGMGDAVAGVVHAEGMGDAVAGVVHGDSGMGDAVAGVVHGDSGMGDAVAGVVHGEGIDKPSQLQGQVASGFPRTPLPGIAPPVQAVIAPAESITQK